LCFENRDSNNFHVPSFVSRICNLDAGSGHVSEKTDAFAFGIVLVELLISAADAPGGYPATVTLEARSFVDTNGQMMLSSAVQAKALSGDWARSAKGKQAAKILGDAAASCIAPTATRRTPVHVLKQLVEAHKLGQLGYGY
jgi:hypothetical protein